MSLYPAQPYSSVLDGVVANGGATTDASLLVSGTLSDARLSANVALENLANVFTAKQSFSGTTHVGLCLNSLTTAEYTALTATNGDIFRDSTTDRIDARLTRGTVELIDSAGGQTINGALTVSGILSSSNTTAATLTTNGSVRLAGGLSIASGGAAIAGTVMISGFLDPTAVRSGFYLASASGQFMVGNGTTNRLGLYETSSGSGTFEINNGTLGTLRDLSLRNITASGTGSFVANVLLANSAGVRFSSTSDPSGTSDSGIIRGGSSLIDVLATNGVRFRNGNNTADAPVTCSNLTASGTITASGTGTHTFGTTNTVTMTAGVLKTIAGTKSAPAIQLGYSASNTGLYGSAAGTNPGLGLTIGGTTYLVTQDSTTGLCIHSGWGFCWGSSQADNIVDTALRRSAAGVVEINNGTLGTLRDLSLRNITASGTITYSSIAFPELVTNGGFDTDTAWTKGTGWTISGGTAVATGAASFADIQQNLPAVNAGQTYVITFTVSITSGTIAAYLGANGNGNSIISIISASGSYSFLFHKNPLDATKTILFRGNPTFTGTIDNVSVKRAF